MGGHHSVPMFCFQNGLLISLHCFLFNSSTPESFVNILKYFMHWVSQVVLVVKNPSASAGDTRDVGLIPGSGRSPGEGNGNPLQHSCLRIPWTEEPDRLQSMGSQDRKSVV